MTPSLNLAWVIDPLKDLKPSKDSSLELMRVAAARGHRLFVIEPHDLGTQGEAPFAYAMPIGYTSDSTLPTHLLEQPVERPLHDFQAIVMRKDPPFDAEYLYATHLLELAENQGVKVYNRPHALRDHNEKLATLRFPQLIPPTLVARRPESFRAFLHTHQDIILKPLDGMGGKGVFRVRVGDPNISVILETLSREGRQTFMAQRYLPEIKEGDKRILMIAGEPLPYALARLPAPGETRGNLAAGGRGIAQPLSPSDHHIAQTVGPFLRQSGILLAGLDVIGTSLTEINVTSPTCLREIRDQTGLDGAALVMDALERACRQI